MYVITLVGRLGVIVASYETNDLHEANTKVKELKNYFEDLKVYLNNVLQ